MKKGDKSLNSKLYNFGLNNNINAFYGNEKVLKKSLIVKMPKNIKIKKKDNLLINSFYFLFNAINSSILKFDKNKATFNKYKI
ncbi:hypothetical protein JTY60_01830 [symbiont of Argiope bruennichi]|uniref:hypothetical protein n=1 Tax=symbiont of Argiope bruennichi TaxID=2810479 RepID=UPI003DA60AA5